MDNPFALCYAARALDRERCAALDASDPLGHLRARFDLPDGLVYLDGNSLGPLSHAASARLERLVHEEWGARLIAGWTEAGWLEAPLRAGRRIAPLIGAAAGEVVVCDSVTVDLYKLVGAALRLRPDRPVVVVDPEDFPTDRYVTDGLAVATPRLEVRRVDAGHVTEALDERVALVVLSHVGYRSGRMLDMVAITAAAHRTGAVVLWDLCHSAGAVPVDLDGCDADLAVGCSYKFLNGGPGAPAFCYVARRLQDSVVSPIQGWFGHADPFQFGPTYEPAPGIRRLLAGTTGMLGLAALEGALEIWDEVRIDQARTKSMAMGDLLIRLVDERCAGQGLEVASPRDAARRGSQVSLRHPRAGEVARLLAARGVVTDFRPPDLVRVGLTPLYTRYVDLWDAVQTLHDVLAAIQEPAR
jgi:kynureninase